MRPILPLVLLLFPLGNGVLRAQDAALSGRIFEVEDRRAPSETDLAVLLRGLASPDARVAARAARALGRLERAALAPRLLPLLGAPAAAVRRAAAEAVAQAAQGFRGDSSLEHRGAPWVELVEQLGRRVLLESDDSTLGVLALSLGRLPYLTGEEIRLARERMLALSRRAAPGSDAERAAARGLETLVRATARALPLGPELVARLAELARAPAAAPRVRRHALGALFAGQVTDTGVIAALLRADDPESRRLAVTGLPRWPEGPARSGALAKALADSAAAVRLEAVRVAARTSGPAACPALSAMAADPAPPVALAALDALAGCGDAAAALGVLTRALVPGEAPGWHRAAHALVSLAHAAPERARGALPPLINTPVWQSRMYAARAAAVLKDSAALQRLARDSVANVREAALTGMVQVLGHGGDAFYRTALSAGDYQLVLTAAQALKGTPAAREAALTIQAQLARITAERKETSRDARMALLLRLRELGSPRDSSSLPALLADFDPAVADSAAAILTAWTGRPQRAQPRRLPVVPVTLTEALALGGQALRFTMAAGGVFDVELYPDVAPATVARIARLVRKGYYDGLTWHRVVANFVIQGGSPGANEYAGDGAFIRDELSARSHDRGTLGVSTRGRDTGDGQLFINLVDNPRLDYDYTVWGRVVAGMEVVDAILEGDVIRRVEIRPR